MVPDGWIDSKLGEWFALTSGATKPIDLVPCRTDTNTIPVYGGNGIMGFTSSEFSDEPHIIIGRVGEYCGCVHVVEGQHWITDNALFTKSWKQQASLVFFGYLLNHIKLSRLRNKGGQPLISQKPIYGHRTIVPPINEQERIAAILCSWDQAIDQVQKLIDAKAQLKKGLMQQLLAGKRRIPGQTSSTHKEYRIGDLLKGVKRDIEFDDDTLYGLISVRRRSGGLFHRESLYGRDILTKHLKEAKKGDFLISKMQIVHGAAGLVTQDFDGMKISGSYIALVPSDGNKLDIRYFNYLSQIPYMYHLTYLASYGVHIEKMTFNLRLWLRSKIKIPKDTRQQARIVSVLDSINMEIQSLMRYKVVLQNQKRGLMQVLLTGKVRVKPSDSKGGAK